MIKNAKTIPQLYYGLHMEIGVAEYREPKQQPLRIFIGEQTIKNMDASFRGRPVYVQHVAEVDLENIQAEADGYVVRSFFNKSDGKHWVEFLVVSDQGHEAVRSGWKLSNAYVPQEMSSGGMWHGLQYDKEVVSGKYDHLAIVPNPRYEDSIILTPEEFKAYNEKKEAELSRLANSKQERESMLNFFKKSKVEKLENAQEIDSLSVVLPKSKKEMSISDLVTEMDKIVNMQGYANGDHAVKVGDEEMTVNDLVAKHLEMKKKMDAADQADGDAKEAEAKGEGELKANDEDDKKKADEEKMKNAKDAQAAKDDADKKAKAEEAKKNFDSLKNAEDQARATQKAPKIEFSSDRVARGRTRYGS